MLSYLSRSGLRAGRLKAVDPVCVDITHYRRCGKLARFEFRCLLQSRLGGHGVGSFWLPYLLVADLREASRMLAAKGWHMRNYLTEYSDGEEVWASDYDSGDEELAHRRRTRGRTHCLDQVRARRRSQPAR